MSQQSTIPLVYEEALAFWCSLFDIPLYPTVEKQQTALNYKALSKQEPISPLYIAAWWHFFSDRTPNAYNHGYLSALLIYYCLNNPEKKRIYLSLEKTMEIGYQLNLRLTIMEAVKISLQSQHILEQFKRLNLGCNQKLGGGD